MASLGEGGGGLLALVAMETPVVSSAAERYTCKTNLKQIHSYRLEHTYVQETHDF